jgi:hypothetical protein
MRKCPDIFIAHLFDVVNALSKILTVTTIIDSNNYGALTNLRFVACRP